MFRALCARHQEVKIILYRIWYRYTETSEWSKITKIQFYKYEHIVVEFMLFKCDYTSCCIMQFRPPDDEHIVLETCRSM